MLRFSDDETPAQDGQPVKNPDGTTTIKTDTAKHDSGGAQVGPNKPNFVYIVCEEKFFKFKLF